jgi:general secretion pathway protein I
MCDSRDKGFTLLEVLVALAIAALALIAMFRAGGDGLIAVNTASRYEESLQRAQSHLAALGRNAALLQGDSEGDDGGGFRWRLHIAPVASWQAAVGTSASSVMLFDVEIAVYWPGVAGQRGVRLRTRRLASAMPER